MEKAKGDNIDNRPQMNKHDQTQPELDISFTWVIYSFIIAKKGSVGFELKTWGHKRKCDQYVRLAGGSFLEVSSHLQGRLMHSSHGGKGGGIHMLILLNRED
ncbi:hypothetical protein YC2023_063629 [Brassica napus]